MEKGGEMIVGVLGMVVTVAILAVIFSKQANTANVITAFGQAFGGILGAAVAPITSGGGNGLSIVSDPTIKQ